MNKILSWAKLMDGIFLEYSNSCFL